MNGPRSRSRSSDTQRRTSSCGDGQLLSDKPISSVHITECYHSPSVGEGRKQSDASDVITSSLRTLELIRQLSFDTTTPKIIDISDTTGDFVTATPTTLHMYFPDVEVEQPPPPLTSTPSEQTTSPPLPPSVRRIESSLTSPPFSCVYMRNSNLSRTRTRSSSVSEISDSDGYDATDFDDMVMVMDPLPNQQIRRRLASDQSPYAVSSASTSEDHSLDSSTEREIFHWHDPIGCAVNLGINYVDSSELEITQDVHEPCPRLSIDSLQEWNMLCEQEGNVTTRQEYVATALSPTVAYDPASPSLSYEAEEVEGVHMMFAPSLSASLSYTHTGVPSTVSNSSSEFHDVEDVLSSTNHDDESYSQSLELSFQINLPGDAIVLHQEKTDIAVPHKRHRRHKSDGFVLLPKVHSSLKKKPGHQRVNSIDLFLQSIPESPTDVMRTECDMRAECFFANSGCSFNRSCAADVLRKHRRYHSDSVFLTF